MANQKHCDMLEQGVAAWNAWREKSPDVRPNLKCAQLYKADLRGANLRNANLRDANLRGADLRDANLRDADLRGADTSDADLRGADTSGADTSGADLRGAITSGADLHHADLSAANLRGGRLRDADLHDADLRDADLRDADLHDADLSRADLRDADLTGATLTGADLRDADLSRATLTGADLTGANLTRANLTSAVLAGATLTGANLIGAILHQADLSGASVRKAKLGETIFADTDLSTTRDLDTCIHRAPSSIDHRTLIHSGTLPQVFPRGCGLQDPEATGVQFHSVFISHAAEDAPFAAQLHTDLQQAGVRCWLAPHDLPVGERVRRRIDKAIHHHDKVVVVLSAASLGGDWLEREVDAALERQRREKRMMLFPVRMDDAALKATPPWASEIRPGDIRDFSHWTDPASHQMALQRLLADLRAEVEKK
ncbi:MAG: toll/interleukin-1 receptor domain-containing protein [Nitrospirota bacterium]|nr:toll/interleukin-1 receptor domain-containing protein [Nitrospirota bacterium]